MGQPGMRIQTQQGQVSSTGMQLQQTGNMIPMQNQPVMSGMQQQMGGIQQQQQPTLGTIGQQHSLGGPGQPQQIMGIRQTPMAVINPQQGIHVKQEVVTTISNVSMVQQRIPAQQQIQHQQPSQTQDNTNLSPPQTNTTDPIVRFKLLLPQLKESLVNLISVARQNFAGNATNDNSEKTVDTNLLPRFDKALEHFYSICNQIEANLCLASDQILQTMSSIQHAPLSSMKDAQTYPSYLLTVKQQLAYAKDIQSMLIESSNKNLAAHQVLPGMGHRP